MVIDTKPQQDEGSAWEARLARALAEAGGKSSRPWAARDLSARAVQALGLKAPDELTPAAVLIPIRRHQRTPSIILNLRSRELRNHAGEISFPGGRRDALDDGPVANALREAHEEMGLDPACVSVIGFLNDYPTVSGFRVTPVVAMVDESARTCPDRVEVEEVFDVPVSFLLNPDNYRRKRLQHDGVELGYYEIPYGNRHIWGATAAMLHELACRVGHSGA